MNVSTSLNLLPLLTLGLPDQVVGWLNDAGLPLAALDCQSVRRGVAAPDQTRSIVLYDGRNASARSDADAAAALGLKAIDVARLLIVRPNDTESPVPADRAQFLVGLRIAIEHHTHLWVRLADFPFPYGAAICEETERGASEEIAHLLSGFGHLSLPATAERTGLISAQTWIQECLRTGRPVCLAKGAAAKPQKKIVVWQCTLAEFARWWQFRGSVNLSVRRHDRVLEVVTSLPRKLRGQPAYPLALEVWRGQHVARIPLTEGTCHLPTEGIPFQSDTARHPAGFTVGVQDSTLRTAGPSHHATEPATLLRA